jgi:hypothetical protein
MERPITAGGVVPALISKARVLDVDVSTYTLTVATAFSKKPMSGISFATPYQHFVNGEGIYFMPEVGSLCWLCEPSDNCMPFVLAWGAAQDEADYTARKLNLNPGDIVLATRDENFMILRRGGVVEIGANGLCQRLFLPVNNTIKDFCENYALKTLGGDLEWSIARQEDTKDGKRPALLKVLAKEFANDPSPIADLEIGSHGEQDKTILKLVIRDKSAGSQMIALSMTKEGDVTWEVKRNLSQKIEGDMVTEVSGKDTLKVGKTLTVEVTEDINMKSNANAKLQAQEVTVDAPTTKTTGVLKANGSTPVALATPLVQWLVGHTHNLTTPSPGSPTTPPVGPPPQIDAGNLFSS